MEAILLELAFLPEIRWVDCIDSTRQKLFRIQALHSHNLKTRANSVAAVIAINWETIHNENTIACSVQRAGWKQWRTHKAGQPLDFWVRRRVRKVTSLRARHLLVSSVVLEYYSYRSTDRTKTNRRTDSNVKFQITCADHRIPDRPKP